MMGYMHMLLLMVGFLLANGAVTGGSPKATAKKPPNFLVGLKQDAVNRACRAPQNEFVLIWDMGLKMGFDDGWHIE